MLKRIKGSRCKKRCDVSERCKIERKNRKMRFAVFKMRSITEERQMRADLLLQGLYQELHLLQNNNHLKALLETISKHMRLLELSLAQILQRVRLRMTANPESLTCNRLNGLQKTKDSSNRY